MSRAALKAVFAEFEAEDRAVSLLDELPPKTASLVALTVAKSEAKRWQAEKLKMIRQRDRRPIYDVHSEDTAFLDAELAAIPSDCASDNPAEVRVCTIMASLPADAAAQVSFNVARWAVHRAERTEP